MRRFALVCASAAALSALTVSAASGIGPGITGPIGATVTEEGRAPTQQEGNLPFDQGRAVLVQTYTVPPGGSTGWTQHVSDGAFLITKGMLTKYTSCTSKEMWEPGKSYLQTEQDPGYGSPVILKNEGSVPAEFIAVFTSAAPDLPANGFAFTAAAGPPECAGALDQSASVGVKDITRGLAYSGKGGFHVTDKGSVVIQRIALEPGYSTGWHHHPDASVVIQTKGKLVNYLDCQAKEDWTQGNAYLHVPSEAKHAHANLTKNEESGQAELVLLFFNVPNEQPAGTVPISPAEPPTECPTMH